MKRSIALALAIVVVTGMLAVPAAAEKSETGLIANGTAKVGRTFATPCDKKGNGVPAGQGLFLPTNPNKPNQFVWAIDTPIAVLSQAPGNTTGQLKACGWGQGVFGGAKAPDQLGPWCGMSKGYHGVGKATADGKPGIAYQLTKLGWKETIAGAFVVKGNAEQVDLPNKQKSANNKRADVLALINAQGGLDCNSANGATTFTVNGSFAITQPEVNDDWNEKGPVLQENEGTECKLFTKDDDCWYKEKKDHDDPEEVVKPA